MMRLPHFRLCLGLGFGLMVILACGVAENLTTPTQPGGRATLPPKTARATSVQPVETVAVTPVESIYTEAIPVVPADRIQISELSLMQSALQLLVETNWDGSQDTPFPISSADFDQAQLAAYIADEAQDDQALTVPAELEELYLSPAAVSEISALLLQAQAEYVAYMEAQSVRAEYLQELNTVVLPADPARWTYHPDNDPNAPFTAVGPTVGEAGVKDFGRLQMDMYPVDVYNAASSLADSQILGAMPAEEAEKLVYARQYRDMAVRFLVYHEMTHAVQRMYINLHVSEDKHSDKSASVYATQTLVTVDTQYHWRWGGHFADLNNEHVSDESQAEGISYEILVNLYDMSPQQKHAVWDYLYGRLEDGQAVLNNIRDLLDTHYPDYTPDVFGEPLANVMEAYPDSTGRYTLMTICNRLAGLPDYVGYLNPMLPEDTPKFWKALQEP